MGDKPLYQSIKDSLLEKIISRQLLPGQQLPTEIELARQFGVSRITSKRALEELENEGHIRRHQGQGSFVSAPALKTASGPGHKIISLVMPHFNTETRAMAYIKGAMDFLHPRGYFLTIHDASEQDEHVLLNQLVRDGVSGIIYFPAYTVCQIDVLTAIKMNRIPLVTIDKYYDGLPISSVVSDNYRGEYLAVQHLVNLGHRNIALICSSQIGERSSVRDRFLGYCQALRDAGLPIVQDYILDNYFKSMRQCRDTEESRDYLGARLQKLLDSRVTAMLIENDYEGIKIHRILSNMGLVIPDDLSMIGYDNSDMLVQNGIDLTTVNQHFHQIGCKAAELVLYQISQPDGLPQHIVLPVELVPGKTTAAPPGSRSGLSDSSA